MEERNDQPKTTHVGILQRILPELQKHPIETVTVTFDGGGDHGQIDDIIYTPSKSPELDALKVTYDIHSVEFCDGEWKTTTKEKTGSIDDAIEELTYSYLSETGIDWYNDQGGFGELDIGVAEGTAELTVNVRCIEYDEYSYELDIPPSEKPDHHRQATNPNNTDFAQRIQNRGGNEAPHR